jgi:hypothetical protein
MEGGIMAYIKRKARNNGFHDRRHAKRAAVGVVQRALVRIAGYTEVTVKRHADAFKAFAREHFPDGLDHVRERRPGVLHLTRPARSTRQPMKLRANWSGRMAEIG